jgi:hypothetical protein
MSELKLRPQGEEGEAGTYRRTGDQDPPFPSRAQARGTREGKSSPHFVRDDMFFVGENPGGT